MAVCCSVFVPPPYRATQDIDCIDCLSPARSHQTVRTPLSPRPVPLLPHPCQCAAVYIGRMAGRYRWVWFAFRRRRGEPTIQHIQQGDRAVLHPRFVPAGHRVSGWRASIPWEALPRVRFACGCSYGNASRHVHRDNGRSWCNFIFADTHAHELRPGVPAFV